MPEGRQDERAEVGGVSGKGGGPQARRRGLPALHPIGDGDPPRRRVDPSASCLVDLNASEEALGVAAPWERL